MSEYIPIECKDCPYFTDKGYAHCAQDESCNGSIKWLADHDAKVRADAIDELEKMLEDYKTMGMVSMANVHLFGNRVKEQKNE